MKNLKLFLRMTAVLLLVVLTAFKCGSENEPEPVNTTNTTTNFDYQNFGCGMYFANMQANTVYVINSEEDFARYFNCETDPQIDFATKTLLFAFGTAPGGVGNKTVELIQNNENYTLKVDITLNDADIAGEGYTVAVIVDKINNNNIILTTNFIQL
jgi:hypothetical protein